MPSEDEVSGVLGELADKVVSIGDLVSLENHPSVLVETPNPESGQFELRGHRCRRDDAFYFIGAHPDLEYVRVAYFLSIVENIAADIHHNEATAVLQAANIGWQEGEATKRASKYLLNNFHPQEETDFRSYFKTLISSPLYGTTINLTDAGRMESFSIQKKLFPYSQETNLREMEDVVQTVVGAGKRGGEVVFRSLSVEFDESNPENSRLSYQR